MQIISSDKARELLSDEWAVERLYNIDYVYSDHSKLALYKVTELSQNSLNQALAEKQSFLFDGEL